MHHHVIHMQRCQTSIPLTIIRLNKPTLFSQIHSLIQLAAVIKDLMSPNSPNTSSSVLQLRGRFRVRANDLSTRSGLDPDTITSHLPHVGTRFYPIRFNYRIDFTGALVLNIIHAPIAEILICQFWSGRGRG